MVSGIQQRNKGWDNIIQKPLAERWWLNVGCPDVNGCWPWLGAKNHYGYGKIRNHYKMVGAHRIAYELLIGEIPNGCHVLHHCDNRVCVNPSHLFLGNQSENNKDMFAKGRNRNQYSNNTMPIRNGRSKIVEVFITNEWIRYDTMTEAANRTGVNLSKISMAANGLRNKAGGLKWRIVTI